MRIAICDDNNEILQSIKHIIEKGYSSDLCGISAFTDEEAFLGHVLTEEVDIAIIDIMLGKGISGIDIAKQINRDCANTAVIFISSSTDYIEEVYDTDHLIFLKKPLKAEKLYEALRKAARKITSETIVIKHKDTIRRIDIDSIVMIESFARNLVFHIIGGEKYECTGRLYELEKILPPADFVRCHHSVIVNTKHINEIHSNDIHLTGGLYAPISRRKSVNVKAMIYRMQTCSC